MKILEKIIEYGLYLLVFLLPLQTRLIIKSGLINGGYSEYGTVSLYATDILLIILLFCLIVYKLNSLKIQNLPLEKESLLADKFIKIIWLATSGLYLISLISLWFASDKSAGFYGLAKLTLGIGFFWLVSQPYFNKIRIFWSLLLAVAIQAALAGWQFINQATFASKWLGIAIHPASDLGTSVIETVGSGGIGERWLRAYGGLDHPNILGGLIAIGILLAISFIVYYNYQDKKNYKNKILKYSTWLIFILFFFSLIFSFSRAAWLGFIIGIFIVLIIAIIKKDWLEQRSILEIILVVGVIFFILFNQYDNLFITRVANSQRLEIKSTAERVESYKISWQLIKANWLFGVGLGNYTFKVEKEIKKNMPSYYYQPVNNTIFLVWSEIGIMGLIFYLIIIIFACALNFYRRRIKENFKHNYIHIFTKYYAIIFIAIVIMMMFDHWWWSLHFGVLFFWLTVGSAVSVKGKY